MVHVGRSLGVVVVGWASGFLIAIAWGATRANNPRLASTLSGWAIVGMVVTGVLLLSIAVSDRAGRAPRPSPLRPARARDPRQPRAPTRTRREPPAAEERSAARIAELEARLAREQEELDAAVASLAATELAETGRITGGVAEPDSGRRPLPSSSRCCARRWSRRSPSWWVATEPARGRRLAGELEALLEKAR